jgi:hypothetical protein
MRVSVATVLVKLAARVLAGRDDRVALLNTRRYRARPGTADPGRVHAFVVTADEPRRAITFSPGQVPKGLGTPVPQRLARLAGYDLEPIA